MTQEEIQKKLHRLRYEGGWSLRDIAGKSGLAVTTIKSAMTRHVSEQTQARLSHTLPLIPRYKPKKISKKKPGHLKRYLIRYYNLKGWLAEIEKEPGIEKKFSRRPQFNQSRDQAAYTCARYDYQMKYHLLSLFGAVLKQHHVVMGDPYPAEQWILRIHKLFPGLRPALFKKIIKREIKK